MVMVTVFVAVSVTPFASVTVRVTVYFCALRYLCVGLDLLFPLLSPKSQRYFRPVPELLFVNWTTLLVTVNEKPACGPAGGTVGVGVGGFVGRGVGVGVCPGGSVGVGVTSSDGLGVKRSVGSGVNESGANEKKKGVGVGAAVACADGDSCVKAGSEDPGVLPSPISPNDCCGCGGVDR